MTNNCVIVLITSLLQAQKCGIVLNQMMRKTKLNVS